MIPIITFRGIDDQRIPKSDWIRAFSDITCAAEFFQIRSLHCEKDTGKAFHFRLLPAERNSAETQETPFWAHSGPFLSILGQTRIHVENPLIQISVPDGRMDGWISMIHRTSPSKDPKILISLIWCNIQCMNFQ